MYSWEDITGDELYELNRHGNRSDPARLTYSELAARFGVSRGAIAGKIARREGDNSPQIVENDIMRKSYQRPEAPAQLFEAAVFDIETTDFGAIGYNGVLVCISVLPLRSDEVKTVALKPEDRQNDKRVLREALKLLWPYDLLIPHYGAGFDFNWLDTRCQHHAWPTPRTWLYFDTYQQAKSRALKTRKGLGHLGDFFDLDGEKTIIGQRDWSRVRSSDPEEFADGIAEVIYHCEQDVILTRQVWDNLFPRSLEMGPCPIKMTKWRTGKMPFAVWDRHREIATSGSQLR
jgi:uncharacterized protein YprB with RNaseH-like and TPR domain